MHDVLPHCQAGGSDLDICGHEARGVRQETGGTTRTVMADTREAHTDCAPIPPDVAEVLQKGPRGPDGKGLRKVLEYFTSKDPHYVVETRPNKRAQGRELGRWTADWRGNFVI